MTPLAIFFKPISFKFFNKGLSASVNFDNSLFPKSSVGSNSWAAELKFITNFFLVKGSVASNFLYPPDDRDWETKNYQN